jgi:UDP-glucose 4-epimerase
VYGDNKILDFTYIDDCVSGIYRTIDDFGKAKNSTFNIASGKGRSLVELAKLIVEMTDADSKIKIQDNRTGEVNKYVGDISRAEKILDYTPEYSLTEGIKKTVKWYDKNQRVQQEVLDDSTD